MSIPCGYCERKEKKYEEVYRKFVIMNWFSECSEQTLQTSIKTGQGDSESILWCPLAELKLPRPNMRVIICFAEALQMMKVSWEDVLVGTVLYKQAS